MKKIISNIVNKLGYTVSKVPGDIRLSYPDIVEAEFWEIYQLCQPYTMTSVERMYALYSSTINVLANNIQGDFVECGVWRGGSSMMIAKMLSNRNLADRKLYLYDTFEGMSAPSASDVDLNGQQADNLLQESEASKETSVWCLADLADVQQNLKLTGYPVDKLVFVKGKVEDTIPHSIPVGPVALLRLDTDWYDSTKHELIHLYPKLALDGILIIDDYGHWQGCRKAVDEYFEDNKINILLNRIDYTGRVGIKTA